MATSESTFLFIGGCRDGEWIHCDGPYVRVPVLRGNVDVHDATAEIEYEEYRRFGIRIYSGGAIHQVYLSGSVDPDESLRLLMRGYRGKENQ